MYWLYTTLSQTPADSSSYDLGAVLLQKQQNSGCRPVVYASRTLTECEGHHVQVEKELSLDIYLGG